MLLVLEKHPGNWSMCEDRFQVLRYENIIDYNDNINYNDGLVELQLKVLSDVLMFR